MTIKTPNVSICIPTRNRLHYLKQMLPTLLAQAQSLGMQVCVSDNASTDGTIDYLQVMSAQFPCLKFIRHHESLTLDESMHAAIRMAEGNYVFPIGDDDFLLDGALLQIEKELEISPDMLVLNAFHTGPNLEKLKEHLSKRLINKSFLAPDTAFFELWDKMHFGSFVFSKLLFSDKSFERYYGTKHAYSGFVWDGLLIEFQKTGSCFVKCSDVPVVLLRCGEKSWHSSGGEIHYYDIPRWFLLLPEYYGRIYKGILEDYFDNLFKVKNLIKYRALGQLTRKLLNLVTDLDFKINKKYIFLFKLSIYLPVNIAKIIILIQMSLNNSRKHIKEIFKCR